MAGENRSVLIVGGNGALGRVIVAAFKQAGWTTIAADLSANDNASVFVKLGGEMSADAAAIIGAVGEARLDAVVAVAGGWAGGDIGSQEVFDSTDRMIRYNLFSSVVAGHVAAKLLKPDGLLVLTGAEAALTPARCVGMIGYGVSKAAVHHLVQALAAQDGGLPASAVVCAICPRTIDTPSNRAAMPGANFADWTPSEEIAAMLLNWAADAAARPARGALLAIVTQAGVTTTTPSN